MTAMSACGRRACERGRPLGDAGRAYADDDEGDEEAHLAEFPPDLGPQHLGPRLEHARLGLEVLGLLVDVLERHAVLERDLDVLLHDHLDALDLGHGLVELVDLGEVVVLGAELLEERLARGRELRFARRRDLLAALGAEGALELLEERLRRPVSVGVALCSRGRPRVRVAHGVRLRGDADEDQTRGVGREVPGLAAALEVVVGADVDLLHLVRVEQVLDAAQVLRRGHGPSARCGKPRRRATRDGCPVLAAREDHAVARASHGEERDVALRRHGVGTCA